MYACIHIYTYMRTSGDTVVFTGGDLLVSVLPGFFAGKSMSYREREREKKESKTFKGQLLSERSMHVYLSVPLYMS